MTRRLRFWFDGILWRLLDDGQGYGRTLTAHVGCWHLEFHVSHGAGILPTMQRRLKWQDERWGDIHRWSLWLGDWWLLLWHHGPNASHDDVLPF